jgi:pilus assembly protein Flp/PilA
VEHVMKLSQFLRDQTGVTGIEFTLIAGGIAIATILIMTSLGSTLMSFFTSLDSTLKPTG